MSNPEQPLRVAHLVESYEDEALLEHLACLAGALVPWGVRLHVAAWHSDRPAPVSLTQAFAHSTWFQVDAQRASVLPAQIIQWLQAEGIRALHTHTAGAFIYGATAGAAISLPLVHTEHAHAGDDPHRQRWHRLPESTQRRITADSPSVAADFSTESHPIQVVRPGVALRALPDAETVREARLRLGAPAEALVVGIPRALRHWTDARVLLEASARLVAAGQSVHLLLFSTPECLAGLQPLLDVLHLKGHATVLPEEACTPQVLCALDVAVLGKQPGMLPPSALEVLQLGKPLLAEATPQLCELLDAGGGIAVPANDERVLAEALTTLAGDRACLQSHALAARRNVEQRHDLDATARAWAMLYRDLAA
jgi:glycosyltransferase involved in cell wall biosynthesis